MGRRWLRTPWIPARARVGLCGFWRPGAALAYLSVRSKNPTTAASNAA